MERLSQMKPRSTFPCSTRWIASSMPDRPATLASWSMSERISASLRDTAVPSSCFLSSGLRQAVAMVFSCPTVLDSVIVVNVTLVNSFSLKRLHMLVVYQLACIHRFHTIRCALTYQQPHQWCTQNMLPVFRHSEPLGTHLHAAPPFCEAS